MQFTKGSSLYDNLSVDVSLPIALRLGLLYS